MSDPAPGGERVHSPALEPLQDEELRMDLEEKARPISWNRRMASALLEHLMLIPVGEDVSVAVTVVVLGSEPDVTSGELRRLDWDSFRLVLPATSHAKEGTRLIVTVGDRTKLAGRVMAVEDAVLVVSRDPTHATDDRAAPRVMGKVTVRWRPADGEVEAWLAGGPDPGPFSAFSGTADVSMSGIRFITATAPSAVGSRVLIELGLSVDGAAPAMHRLVGLVRRIEHLAPGSNSAIGVEFLDVTENTLDALSDFTLENL